MKHGHFVEKMMLQRIKLKDSLFEIASLMENTQFYFSFNLFIWGKLLVEGLEGELLPWLSWWGNKL